MSRAHRPVKVAGGIGCSCGWRRNLGSVLSDQVRAHYFGLHAGAIVSLVAA